MMKDEQGRINKLLLTVGKYVGVTVEGELDTEGTFDIVGIIVFCMMCGGYGYERGHVDRRLGYQL